jgi:hypothetical protein
MRMTELRDKAKDGHLMEDSGILQWCDCGNPDPLHEPHTPACMVTVNSIYLAGHKQGYKRGQEDCESRSRNRPGDGDMGG